MNKETWKDVRGYEGLYEVSDLGRIRSLGRTVPSKNGSTQRKRVRILVQEINMNGYCRVRLFDKDGHARHCQVHRLVLEAFSGPSDLQVNHINEIKTDNRLTNLEYCTPKENCNHGKRNQTISQKRKGNYYRGVVQMTLEGEEVGTYSSRIEAARQTGIRPVTIGLCCEGTVKSAGGYLWRNK